MTANGPSTTNELLVVVSTRSPIIYNRNITNGVDPAQSCQVPLGIVDLGGG